MAARPTKPVSVRVPLDLPAKVKAKTGLPFSRAVVMIMEAFVNSSSAPEAAPPASEDSHD